MEEKTQDKYQEPIEGEPIALEKKPQLEKEVSVPESSVLNQEKILELEKQLAEREAELTKLKKMETEPTLPVQVQKQVQKQVKGLSQSSQVEELCELAFQKGLDFAIEAAKALDNAYVLDQFHDTLVSKLYNELVEKGKLKKL